MTNKLKTRHLKYLLIRYLRNYIKLPVLLFTFLIFKDSFSEQGLKSYGAYIKYKIALSKNTFSKTINLIAILHQTHQKNKKNHLNYHEYG